MITITETARNKIQKLLQSNGYAGIRVGVKTTGCSGLAYVLEYVDAVYDGDCVFESQGVHVYVDSRSLSYVSGLEMNWARNGLNEGFEFVNPNERDRCGCGQSFRV